MSDGKRDDILPEWSDTNMDWLDEIIAEYSTKNKPQTPTEPKPAQQPKQPQAQRPRQTQQPRQTRQPQAQPSKRAEQPKQTQQPRQSQPRREAPVRTYENEEPVRRRTPARGGQGEARRRTPPPEEPPYRRRRRGGMSGLLIALIVVLVLGLIFAAWQLGSIFLNYHRDRSAYEELANRAIVQLAEHDEESEESGSAAESGTSAGGRVKSELPLSVDWEYLRSINTDIVGWLYCPDTVINYPVVQTEDQTFYLTHGFDGGSNTSGTLFADPSAVAGITQSNYIIYGHNMKDESMFGTFKNYVDRSYYDAHPTLYYLTPSGSYRIDLICAHIAESFVTNLPGYFSSTSDYQSYLNSITSDAFWVNYDAVTTDRQLFSMSTCTSAAGFDDARFIVYGTMVPIQ